MKYPRFSRIIPSILAPILVLAISNSGLGQQPPQNDRVAFVRMIVFDDLGRTVFGGVKREWFSVFENKRQLEIASFESINEPASVVFLFDLSGSTDTPFKNVTAQSSNKFMRTHPANDYLIMGFNNETHLFCDWGCDDADLNKALNGVAEYKPQKLTALYDACDTALTKLESSKHEKRVLIIFSDGQDNLSKLTFAKLKARARESSVSIFAISLDLGNGPLALSGATILDEFAAVSGGRAFHPRNYLQAGPKQVTGFLELVALDLSHQYTIGFIPPNAPDDKWHAIKIKLTPPPRDENGVKIRHLYLSYREGYYNR